MLIINVALTGMVPTKKDNPNLPVAPKEIAEDILRCYNAGATIFHIHARDNSGNPTWWSSIYDEIILETRKFVPNAIICGSTSGRLWSDFELRAQVLNCNIQMASLTMGSMNFSSGPSVNSQQTVSGLHKVMLEKNVKPEMEIFDIGMLDYSSYFIEKETVKPPYYFNLFLGSLGTLSAKAENLTNMITKLPKNSIWAATGVGKYQFEVNCWAVALGGNVRVGLEDSVWMDKEKKDLATNVGQVERIVNVARSMGREPATTEQVKELLWPKN
jgi:uncharacterized protein (DUF849 family)